MPSSCLSPQCLYHPATCGPKCPQTISTCIILPEEHMLIKHLLAHTHTHTHTHTTRHARTHTHTHHARTHHTHAHTQCQSFPHLHIALCIVFCNLVSFTRQHFCATTKTFLSVMAFCLHQNNENACEKGVFLNPET